MPAHPVIILGDHLWNNNSCTIAIFRQVCCLGTGIFQHSMMSSATVVEHSDAIITSFLWQILASYIYIKLRHTVTEDFFKGSYVSLHQGTQKALDINMWKFLENAVMPQLLGRTMIFLPDNLHNAQTKDAFLSKLSYKSCNRITWGFFHAEVLSKSLFSFRRELFPFPFV